MISTFLSRLTPRLVAWAAVLVFVGSVAAATSLKPGYPLFFDFLSTLGRNGPGAPWFNYGLMATALLILLFVGVASQRKQKSPLKVVGGLAALVSGAALFGVGLFPSGVEPHHVIASAVFFFSAALAIFLITMDAYQQKSATQPVLILAAAVVLFTLGFGATLSPVLENAAVAMMLAWLLAYAYQVEPNKSN